MKRTLDDDEQGGGHKEEEDENEETKHSIALDVAEAPNSGQYLSRAFRSDGVSKFGHKSTADGARI